MSMGMTPRHTKIAPNNTTLMAVNRVPHPLTFNRANFKLNAKENTPNANKAPIVPIPNAIIVIDPASAVPAAIALNSAA